ncbi:hypothetical protein EJB05_49341, partial [Eragrostis curvula]
MQATADDQGRITCMKTKLNREILSNQFMIAVLDRFDVLANLLSFMGISHSMLGKLGDCLEPEVHQLSTAAANTSPNFGACWWRSKQLRPWGKTPPLRRKTQNARRNTLPPTPLLAVLFDRFYISNTVNKSHKTRIK